MIARLLGLPWTVAAATRVALYRTGIRTRHRLGKPTISVGALEMGGTGKTPATAAIAAVLRDAGRRPAIISRGYGRQGDEARLVSRGDGRGPLLDAASAGDEPWLLAHLLRDVPVGVASRREHAVHLLAETACDTYVLDDAFQHVRVERDLDLLVIDPTRPFWQASPPPLGRLREGPAAARRADALVYRTGADQIPAPWSEMPRVELRVDEGRLVTAVDWFADPAADAVSPAAGGAFAFAGIARPERFFAELRASGMGIAATRAYSDHHRYTDRDLHDLLGAARSAGADWLVTTEKDAARLAGMVMPEAASCYVWTHRHRVTDGAEILIAAATGTPGRAR